MKRVYKQMLLLGGVALVATAGYATVAAAQSQSTPKSWNYELKGGKRVEKPTNVVRNADGSRRSETKQGNCTTVKEWAASGEYKETRQCSPK